MKIIIAILLFCSCSTIHYVDKNAPVTGGAAGAIEMIEGAYHYDDCVPIDTIGTRIILRCK